MRAHVRLPTALLTIIVLFSITIALSLFSSRGEILKIYRKLLSITKARRIWLVRSISVDSHQLISSKEPLDSS